MQLQADPHTLYSFINRGGSWYDLAKELVDNSLDIAAGNANKIWIYISDGEICFIDNGRGISDLNKLGTLGASGSYHYDGNIGQYGIGAKLWLCKASKLRVDTICNGTRHQHTFNTIPIERALAKGRTPPWLEGYEGKGIPTDEASFTALSLSNFRKGPPIHVPGLMSELQKSYWPALRAGIEIVVRDKRRSSRLESGQEYIVTQLDPPRWSDVIEFESSVNGKAYKARIGILSENVGSYSGMWLGYLFRNIRIEKSLVNRAVPARIHGQIELSNDWRRSLSNYKDNIIEDRDELLEDIERNACKILDLADEYAEDIALEKISLEIEGNVSTALMKALAAKKKHARGGGGGKKPEPDPDNPIPEIKTKQSDEDEQGEEQTDTDKLRGTGIRLKWEHMGHDTLYQVRLHEKTIVIALNRDCPKLQAQRTLPRYPGIYLAMGTAIALHCMDLTPIQIGEYYNGMLGDATHSESRQKMMEAIIAWWGFVAEEAKSRQDVA